MTKIHLPPMASAFYIVTSTIEERPGVIQEIRMRNEDVSIQADRNAVTVMHIAAKTLDVNGLALQRVALGSKDWLYYFEKSRRHRIYLHRANGDICAKIADILNAEVVHAIDEENISIQMHEVHTNYNLISTLTERLSVNEKHEFFDGGKKYVLKSSY